MPPAIYAAPLNSSSSHHETPSDITFDAPNSEAAVGTAADVATGAAAYCAAGVFATGFAVIADVTSYLYTG